MKSGILDLGIHKLDNYACRKTKDFHFVLRKPVHSTYLAISVFCFPI